MTEQTATVRLITSDGPCDVPADVEIEVTWERHVIEVYTDRVPARELADELFNGGPVRLGRQPEIHDQLADFLGELEGGGAEYSDDLGEGIKVATFRQL